MSVIVTKSQLMDEVNSSAILNETRIENIVKSLLRKRREEIDLFSSLIDDGEYLFLVDIKREAELVDWYEKVVEQKPATSLDAFLTFEKMDFGNEWFLLVYFNLEEDAMAFKLAWT